MFKLEVFRQSYLHQKDIVSRLISKAKTDFYCRNIKECGDDQKQLFKLVSSFQGKDNQLALPSNDPREVVLNQFATFFSDKIEKIRYNLDHNELNSISNLPTVLPIPNIPPNTTLSVFNLQIELSGSTCQSNKRGSTPKTNTLHINWEKLSSNQLNAYQSKSKILLSQITLAHELLLCDNPSCNDPAHISAINRLHSDIISALLHCGSILQCETSHSNKHVVGWNTYCKELHTESRQFIHAWVKKGIPKHGEVFNQMKVSCALFIQISTKEVS